MPNATATDAHALIPLAFARSLLRDRGERMTDPLDIVKWMCREFWSEVFRKPVDKLQTNNKGTFLLQDLNFRWAKYISGTAADEPGAVALKFTVFCCGLLRGALAAFDMNMVVHVDVSALPKAVFQVRAVEA